MLLSLVRTAAVGHFRDVRRAVVALSRARLGLYVFGRAALFAQCAELAPALGGLLKGVGVAAAAAAAASKAGGGAGAEAEAGGAAASKAKANGGSSCSSPPTSSAAAAASPALPLGLALHPDERYGSCPRRAGDPGASVPVPCASPQEFAALVAGMSGAAERALWAAASAGAGGGGAPAGVPDAGAVVEEEEEEEEVEEDADAE